MASSGNQRLIVIAIAGFLAGVLLAVPLIQHQANSAQRYQLAVMPGLVGADTMWQPVTVKIDTQTGQTWTLTIPLEDGWRETSKGR